MLVDVIFLILFAAAWTVLAMLSWIALSLPRRARGALWAAPFAELGALGGAVIVPLAGLDNEVGIAVSMITALIGSAVCCWLAFRAWDRWDLGRRFARLRRRAG